MFYKYLKKRSSTSLGCILVSTLLMCSHSVYALPVTPPVTPLENQPYALCAGAVTFNFDNVAYAKCQKMSGNSLGLTHKYPVQNNIQTVNDIGALAPNPFIVSTYSPPNPNEYALYDCRKQGSFAQCNGGICSTNSSGKEFPGLGVLSQNEIVCSCPISSSRLYNVWGPSECPTTKQDYDAICASGSQKVTSADGYSLHIGSDGPSSTLVAFSDLYDEKFQTQSTVNKCRRPQ